MSNVLFNRAPSTEISSIPITDGQLIFDTDVNSGKMYLDDGETRKPMGGGITIDTSVSETSTNAVANKAITNQVNTNHAFVIDKFNNKIYPDLTKHGQDITKQGQDITTLKNTLANKAPLVHTHDDRYYTETEVNTLLKNHLKTVYPIGSVYMSFSATSPATLFGGTWTLLKDRFLIGAGSSYPLSSFGGSASHVLSANEMPQHYHGLQVMATNVQALGYGLTAAEGFKDRVIVYSASGNVITERTGGSAAHNNMPPYLAINMWRRTA